MFTDRLARFLGIGGIAICLFMAAALLPPRPCGAQANHISGTVLDSLNQEPVVDALVQVVDSLHQLADQVVSDTTGSFVVGPLEPGNYEIFVSHVGYKRLRYKDFNLVDGVWTILNVQIVPTVIYAEPIVVTVSRVHEKAIDAPASVDVIGSDAIRSRGALTTAEHVRGLAGVDNISKGIIQEGVVVRGFNSAQSGDLLTLVDYRRARVPSLRFNVHYFLPTPNLDIDQVELVRGPGAALYGPNTDRGVLHILTLSPFYVQGTSFEAAVGERDVYQAALRFAKATSEKLAFRVTGQYTRGNDWEFVDSVEVENRMKDIAGGADPDTLRTGLRKPRVERIAGEARIDWAPTPGTIFIASGGFNNAFNNIDLTQIGAVQLRNWKTGYVQGRFRHRSLFGQLYMNMNDAGQSYLLRTGELLEDNSREFGAEIQHGFNLGINSDLLYGIDFFRTDPRTEGTITGRNEDDDDMNELGGYAHFSTSLGKQWDLVAAARIDKNSRFDGAVLSPRAALGYLIKENHNLRLTYNRAFATPATDDLFVDIRVGSLSPLPFDIRAEGVPETGFHYRRDCGGPCMRSPFNPPQLGGAWQYLPADATLMWPAIVEILPPVFPNISMIPPPNSSQVSSVLALLNPETGSFDQIDDVTDIPALERRITNTVELGYVGRLGNRFQVGLDTYVTRVNNFIGPLRVETPNVLIDQASMQAYLEALGLSALEAAQLATAISSIPVGTVSPEEARDPTDVYLTVRNFGDVTIWGLDFSASLLLTKSLWLDGAYSFVSDDFFVFDSGTKMLATNSPMNKGSLALVYQSGASGVFGDIRARAVASFPVISGVYDGRVDTYGLMEATLGYRFLGSNDVLFSLTVQNLLDHRHQQFIGAPELGRFALLRARVDFPTR